MFDLLAKTGARIKRNQMRTFHQEEKDFRGNLVVLWLLEAQKA